MDRLKNVIQNKPQWNGLLQYIQLIELNKNSNPSISLDASKSLLETICKTILINKGVVFAPDSKIGFLVKKNF